jgi:hAT family C-terminal dimerisation region
MELMMELDESVDAESVDAEITDYFDHKVAVLQELLEWWKANAEKYPRIAKLVPIFLARPASSASSECSFSTLGNFFTKKRACLGPVTNEMLCFIKENFGIVQKCLEADFKLHMKK